MNETHSEPLPNNHVVAVISGANAANAAIEALRHAGFPQIVRFQGEEAALSFDPKGENASLLGKLFKAIQDHVSEEPNYLAQYQEEARAGNDILAVEVKDNDQASVVGDLLQSHGAHNVRYFGRLAVTDLSLASNPSSRSAQSPERWSGA